jgi:hypothetical protein
MAHPDDIQLTYSRQTGEESAMSAKNKQSVETHVPTPAAQAWVYGLFPADFTYRISNGSISAYGVTADKQRTGEFEDELERLGFPHVATAWGVSGTELTARVYERHPAESASNALAIPERILIVVSLNCVERYYLAPDLHDALPFLAQLATTSSALAQSMNAMHRREERLRREALIAEMGGSLEQAAKALRGYVATEMLDDALARDDAAHEPELSPAMNDALTSHLPGDHPSGGESAGADDDALLTDLLRRRSRQRETNTND